MRPLVSNADELLGLPLSAYLNCWQAGQLLGVTPGRVRQLIAAGEIPSVKIGRSRFVTKQQVEQYHWVRRNPVGRPKGKLRFRVSDAGRIMRVPVVKDTRPEGVRLRARARSRKARLAKALSA